MKIAIFAVDLRIGGVEKSLVNFCNILSAGHEIDLYLMYKNGPLLGKINQKINVFEINELKKFVKISNKKCLRASCVRKIIKTLFTKFNLTSIAIKKIPDNKYNQNYDIAILYQGLNAYLPEFVAKKVYADKKFVFIHGDFSKYRYLSGIFKYLKMFDKIVAVSKSCMEPIIRLLKVDQSMVCSVNNYINEAEVLRNADKCCIEKQHEKFTIVTVARLAKEKGVFRAVKAIQKLIGNGYDIEYIIVGDGPEHNKISKYIQKNNLEKNILLLGEQTNPYMYIKLADILLIPSYHEAAPLVISEALILHVPILSTNTISAKELIGNNGLVCENSDKGIFNTLKSLLDNEETYKRILTNACSYEYKNNDIKNQIIKFVEKT